MHPQRKLPSAILIAAGLLGSSVQAAGTETAPVDPKTEVATPKAESPAPKAEPQKVSPEDAAKAESRRVIERMTLEKLRLDTEMQIAQLRERASRLADEDERAKVESEAALRAAKLALANAKEDLPRADRDRAIALESLKASLARAKDLAAAAELETDTKLARQESENELLRLAGIAAKNRRENEASKIADVVAPVRPNPVVGDTLYISSRRIVINGPITDATCSGVISKLNFFGIADPKAPVFLVMETVPGGSAMASYQILKAIESSVAPVHIVVKGTVGGSASAIAASGKYSYTLPNSRIVFQQPASPSRATTLGSQRDGLRVAESWYARLHAAVAAKEGLTPDQFATETYKHSGVGEWLEFGDKAVGRKWVTTLVERMVEESVDTLIPVPAPSTMAGLSRGSVEAREDAAGHVWFSLPPLAYGDQWMMYDPEHRYRSAN